MYSRGVKAEEKVDKPNQHKKTQDVWFLWRHAVAQLVEALRYKPGSIPDGVPEHFSLTQPSRPIDSPSDRNEYQEYFFGGWGKGGRCVGLTLPHPCANLSSVSLNLALTCMVFWDRLQICSCITDIFTWKRYILKTRPFSGFPQKSRI